MRTHVRLGSALMVLVLGVSATVGAEPATFSLDKVKRGQTGYGMTTFAGMKPERFTFEVVSVVHNFLPKQDIILVKSDDPKMQTPGFWQGMSGSPLYIDDKLTCAFSYGFRFNKIAIGGCTPIDYMKKEGLGAYRRATAQAAAGGGPKIVQPAAATMSDWRRLTPTVDPQAALDALGPAHKSWLLSAPLPEPVSKPAETDGQTMQASVPLSVAGFSAPAFGQLEKMFGDSNVVPVRAGGTTSTPPRDAPNHFEMGGAIAVELIRGDMSAAAIGTVTYIDGDKVLAFGHPMFQTGETYAPVSTAYVHAIIPSAQSAFVMGSAMTEIGSLTQDRQSSIAADTSLRTPTIPMAIAITTTAGAHVVNGDFKVDLLANKFLTPSIAGAALMNAINYYLPDKDDVTARVESTVKVKGIAEPIQFTDYLYSNDGAASVMGAVRGLRVIVPLLLNPFVPVTIERVDIKVDLRFEANYGDVKELKVTSGDLVPGRNMVKVLMQSYDSKDIIEEIPVDVPKSLAGSIVQLEITSGDAAKLDSAPPTDFPSLVAAFRKLLPGNVWAATIYPADEGVALDGKLVRDLPASVQDKLHPQSHTQRAQVYKPIARTVSPAKRVINGSASMLLRVRAQ